MNANINMCVWVRASATKYVLIISPAGDYGGSRDRYSPLLSHWLGGEYEYPPPPPIGTDVYVGISWDCLRMTPSTLRPATFIYIWSDLFYFIVHVFMNHMTNICIYNIYTVFFFLFFKGGKKTHLAKQQFKLIMIKSKK